MKDHERDIFDKAMSALAEVYRIELTHGQTAGYWQLLKDLSFESFAHAVKTAGQTCKFFPSPAELRGFRIKNINTYTDEGDYTQRCWQCKNFGWEHGGNLYRGVLPYSVRMTKFTKTHCCAMTISRDNAPEDNGREGCPQVYLSIEHTQKACERFAG